MSEKKPEANKKPEVKKDNREQLSKKLFTISENKGIVSILNVKTKHKINILKEKFDKKYVVIS